MASLPIPKSATCPKKLKKKISGFLVVWENPFCKTPRVRPLLIKSSTIKTGPSGRSFVKYSNLWTKDLSSSLLVIFSKIPFKPEIKISFSSISCEIFSDLKDNSSLTGLFLACRNSRKATSRRWCKSIFCPLNSSMLFFISSRILFRPFSSKKSGRVLIKNSEGFFNPTRPYAFLNNGLTA